MSTKTVVETVRVVIADRYLLHRTAMRSVLDSEPGLAVIGEAKDERETLQQAKWLKPDVLLVDMNLFVSNDLGLLHKLHAQTSSTRVLVVAPKKVDALLPRVLDSGARGVMLRSLPLADLVAAINAVGRDEYVVPPQLVSGTVSYFLAERERNATARSLLTQLTPREREVLGLLVEGNGNTAIAGHLVISPETAKGHIYSVMRKIGARSRVEAAAIAVRFELTSSVS